MRRMWMGRAGWAGMVCAGLLVLSVGQTARAQGADARLGLFAGQTDVGSVTPAGTSKYDAAAKTYTISAAGDNLWSTTDAFHFVWKKMSGDLSLTADIDFPVKTGEPNPHRKALLMVRQNLDPDGMYVDVAQHGVGLTALQYRREKGATTQDIELDIAPPKRVRLEKRGDTLTMFVSRDGGPLKQEGASIRMHLAEPFYVGIGVCSHNKDVVETAVFSNVDLKPLKPLPTDAKMAVWSTLQTVGTEDNFRVAKVPYTAQGQFEAPNWTKDGKTLIFNQGGKLMKVAATGGKPEAIDTGAATRCGGSHGISPDQNWLAISCSMPDKPETRVYVIPLAGGLPRVVTEHPDSYFHSWSADGKSILFTRPSHGSGNIFSIAMEGGAEKALTTGDGISDDPDAAPDGEWVYFNSDRAGVGGRKSMQIWRMHTDGSGMEQMTSDELVNWTPHVSPDGKQLVFISYAEGTTGHPSNQDVALRIMNLEDRKVRELVRLVGGSGTMNVNSWAPDSKHLAFVSFQMLPAETSE